MIKSLLNIVRGAVSFILIAFFTLIVALLVILGVLLRLLPIKIWQRKIDSVLHNTPEYWTFLLKCLLDLISPTHWHVDGLKKLDKTGHYLMVANHRSWLDILVLQKIFSGNIPGLRFFMKKELLWQLPLIGFACKLLGYPFVQRYSHKYLAKYPEKKGKDIKAAQKAYERFQDKPVTLINFVEGGRFTVEKHKKQQSPFKYLLRPKAGGLAFILAAMGDCLGNNILDVTILYPNMQITFWDFLCGRVSDIHVIIRTLPIKRELLGDYQNDEHFRKFFQYWLNEQWAEKDKLIINTLIRQDYSKKLEDQQIEHVI